MLTEGMVAGYGSLIWNEEVKARIIADTEKKIREGEEWAKRIREAEVRDARMWGIVWSIPFGLLFLAAALCH